MIKLAIYDMDRTITKRGTYTPFLLYATARLAFFRLLLAPLILVPMLLYVMSAISRARLKEWNQRIMLGPHLKPEELARVTAGFARRTIANNVYHQAETQIAADKADGWRVVLATASYRLYVEAIARELGIDDVIATNSLIGLDGMIQAKIDGENCYGPAKLRMIQAWMGAQGLSREQCCIRFYSDHVSDAVVHQWSDDPVAVNASPKLRRHAWLMGWRALDWR